MSPANPVHLVELQSPFPKGDLLFRSLSATETLGRVFEFDVEALSEKSDLKADAALGKPLCVKLELRDTGKHRFFHGYVTEFAPVGESGRHYVYRLVVRPWLWMLTRTADCRIFQEKKVTDIVKAIFGKYGIAVFDDRLTQSFAVQEYCVQYRETDFNFVSRLMEQEGIYYYFEHHQDRHVMVLADAPSAHAKYPGYGEIPFAQNRSSGGQVDAEVIDHWLLTSGVQPGAFVLNDFDFKRPQVALRQQTKDPKGHAEDKGEFYDYPGGYIVADVGKRYSNLRLEELHAQYQQANGGGNARGLAAGYLFTLKNHFRTDQTDKEYLVVSTHIDLVDDSHESQEGGAGSRYRCQFTALPSRTPFRAPRISPKPHVQGPQTAIVVGPAGDEIYTDEFGRVKVHFHWDRYGKRDQNDSCWMRVATPWAGPARGMVSIPRIGDEVVVDFLEGDPDRPLITGSVYNGTQTPPWALPANKTQSGLLTRSSLQGAGNTNANVLRFEDKKGSEQVWLHAEKDQLIEVEHDEDHTVGNDRRKNVGHDETTEVGNNRTETVGKEENITIGANRTERVAKNEIINIGASRTESVGNDESVTVGDGRTLSVGKDETITIGKNRQDSVGENETVSIGKTREHTVGKDDTLQVAENRTAQVGKDDKLNVGKKLLINAGDEITLVTGDASISMKKDGTIQIKGKDITISGSGKINVKASSDVVIKGSKIAEN